MNERTVLRFSLLINVSARGSLDTGCGVCAAAMNVSAGLIQEEETRQERWSSQAQTLTGWIRTPAAGRARVRNDRCRDADCRL